MLRGIKYDKNTEYGSWILGAIDRISRFSDADKKRVEALLLQLESFSLETLRYCLRFKNMDSTGDKRALVERLAVHGLGARKLTGLSNT